MKSVFISVCSRNTAYWHMFNAFQVAANTLGQKLGIASKLSPTIGDSLISRARCQSLQNFLESDSEWLFTLDDDIELPPDALVKLIEANKPLIGGMYRLKTDKPSMNPYAIRFAKTEKDINFNDIVPVQYLSTGCMMYERSFIEKLVSEYPDLWYYENVTARRIPALYMPYIYECEYLSEDWAFCQRALDKGHQVWLHAGVHCGHWGLHNYQMKDLEDLKEK